MTILDTLRCLFPLGNTVVNDGDHWRHICNMATNLCMKGESLGRISTILSEFALRTDIKPLDDYASDEEIEALLQGKECSL